MKAVPLAMLVALAACDTRETFVLPEWTDSRMLEQPRYHPFGESQYWDDGIAMRPPVAGTVARGAVLGPSAVVTGEEAATEVTAIPVVVDRALLSEGKAAFGRICANCHGLLGDGVSVVATKMQDRPPPSLHDPAVVSLSPGAMFRVVSEGYGLMMPMRTLLTVRERWAVVAYVEALELSQRVPVASLDADERARLEAGR